ncbi:MAG: hypothetical protein CL609_15285 [Anaerolineaceae bacterium]|nr:hypothetical protein [Anaerolineaceae bacterium]
MNLFSQQANGLRQVYEIDHFVTHSYLMQSNFGSIIMVLMSVFSTVPVGKVGRRSLALFLCSGNCTIRQFIIYQNNPSFLLIQKKSPVCIVQAGDFLRFSG